MPCPSYPPLSYYHNTHCPSYCVTEYGSCHRIPGRYGYPIRNSCRLRGHNKRDTPWRRARYNKLLVMYVFHAPDIFFSTVSKLADIIFLKGIEEFQKLGHVEVTSCLVLSFQSALQGTAPIRTAALFLLSVSYAQNIFPCCSTLKMESEGLLKN